MPVWFGYTFSAVGVKAASHRLNRPTMGTGPVARRRGIVVGSRCYPHAGEPSGEPAAPACGMPGDMLSCNDVDSTGRVCVCVCGKRTV